MTGSDRPSPAASDQPSPAASDRPSPAASHQPSPADIQAAFCRVLCDEWARAGVAEAVVAPGSRSTPLVRALDDEPGIRVHVVLDERSAGFVALGLAAASGRPVVVATTSGTASVELHPAVVEAGQASVPLVAVTTDRPPELHHVGAPQTVEQGGLFGPVVRWAFDPGVPTAAGSGAWRSVASRSVAEAVGGGSTGRPGPVHLNLPFAEPLVGDADRFAAPAGRRGRQPWHLTPSRPSGAGGLGGGEDILDLLVGFTGRRGLIVAGAGIGGPAGLSPAGAGAGSSATDGAGARGKSAGAVVELAGRLGWPVLADPRSGARLDHPLVVASADALLRVPELAAAGRPDIVLRIGAPWASKVLGQWLAGLADDVPQVVSDPAGAWADPDRRASHLLAATPEAMLAAVAARGVSAGKESGWAAGWREAEAASQQAIGVLLGAGGALELSEPAIARAALAAVPDGGLLVVSSSMPVRDLEWYGAARSGVRVLANRGANGIDGVVSTALGAALADGAPTTLLIGDLAFLYDAGALLWATRRDVDVKVVVVDNCGGGIFSFLSQRAAESPERFERYWGTPHGVDLVALAGAYGVAAERIADRRGLDRFLGAAGSGVRVAVVGSERDANVAAHERVHAAVAAAVGRIWS